MTERIENYKSIIKKKKSNHDEIELLEKSKLNTNKILISIALIHSYIIYDIFVSVNNI